MIARLETQRRCLDWAAGEIAGLAGPVLEVGLGKGRTFDHLRARLPGREIYAFDRDLHGPEAARPPPERLFRGDFRDSLAAAAGRLGRVAALVHADIGSADRRRDALLAAAIAPLLHGLVRPGGLVLCDRGLDHECWEALPLPGAGAWDYFIRRVR